MTAAYCSRGADASPVWAAGISPEASSHESEAAADGLRREFLEETGLEVEPVRLLRIDIEPYGDRRVFSVTWLVRADGDPVAADDVAELRWFAPGELPDMAFPGQNLVLADWVAGHRQP